MYHSPEFRESILSLGLMKGAIVGLYIHQQKICSTLSFITFHTFERELRNCNGMSYVFTHSPTWQSGVTGTYYSPVE